jgi:hypothetical protein
MEIAVIRVVGGKAAKIAHKRSGKEFFLTAFRRITLLVDMMFHH